MLMKEGEFERLKRIYPLANAIRVTQLGVLVGSAA